MLRFPRRNQPAAPQDVAANTAIFSLPGKARVWPLTAVPLPGLWVADHRYPRHETAWTPPRNFRQVIGYTQAGYVWQAEETADGHRFYGFVGPHDIARVPAEEMEFPPADPYAWTQVAHGLDCELLDGANHFVPYLTDLRAGQPLRFAIRLRSRSGIPQTLPANFLRDQLTLKLLFSRDDPNAAPRDLSDEHRVWEEVSPRQAMLAPPAEARSLETAEEFTAGTVNPDEEFDLSRAGTYRLQFVFGTAKAVTGRQSPEAAFRITH